MKFTLNFTDWRSRARISKYQFPN